MTWFSKMAAFLATLLLLGYTWEVLGYTVHSCKRECKDKSDDHLCASQMFDLDNGGEAPDYVWLRNECERECFMYGEYKRVKMELCTKDGQNYTTYRCDLAQVHPGLFRECVRNESMRNVSNF